MEQKTITAMEELIERLKNDDLAHGQIINEYNGCHAVLNGAYERYTLKHYDDDFDFLRGMLWGLYATRFITDSERDTLIDSLIG